MSTHPPINSMPAYKLFHKMSGEAGIPDASAVWPCGSLLLRINDHWFFAKDCRSFYEAA